MVFLADHLMIILLVLFRFVSFNTFHDISVIDLIVLPSKYNQSSYGAFQSCSYQSH